MFKQFSLLSMVVVSLALLPAQLAEARKHRKKHTIVKTEALPPCSKLPKSCPDNSDDIQGCKTSYQGKSFEENAHDSDNVACVKMRLQKKICDKGLDSENFKAVCQ